MSINDHDSSLSQTPLNAKRRRLNGFTTPATLTRPFKSPFRAPHPSQPTTRASGEATQLGSFDVATGHIAKEPTKESNVITAIATPSIPPRRTLKPFRTSLSSPLIRQTSLSSLQDSTDPDTAAAVAAAQRAQTSLITQIARARQDIDALKQAISLASGTKDKRLGELIERWTSASRAAAEEVFSSTRDKVNRMGGVGAWRERERQQKDWQRQWDEPMPGHNGAADDSGGGEDDEDDDVAEEGMESLGKAERREMRDARRQLKAERRAACEQEYRSEEPERDEGRQRHENLMRGDDDDTFTMDMMLTILNIDLDIIGYSKEHQMWVG